jgi:hypothetical protein
VFEDSAALFSAPAPVREAASFSRASGNRGYIRLGGESLDPDKPADVKEAFNIGLELAADDPELLARAPFRSANLWPDLPGFRDTMLDYFNRVWRLGCDLHRGFVLDLGLDRDFFEASLDKPIATLRLLHYPPVKGPQPDGQLGAGLASNLVPSTVKEFRVANPRVKLSLTLFNTGEEIQSAVANGEADLGIGFDFTKDGNLKVLARAVGRLGAVMAPNHPLAKRSSIRLPTASTIRLSSPTAAARSGPISTPPSPARPSTCNRSSRPMRSRSCAMLRC